MMVPTTTPAPYLTSSMLVGLGAAVLLAASSIRASPQITGNPYQFPADAELYLDAPLDTSFTCEGLDYGFYADVNNNCQVGQFFILTFYWGGEGRIFLPAAPQNQLLNFSWWVCQSIFHFNIFKHLSTVHNVL